MREQTLLELLARLLRHGLLGATSPAYETAMTVSRSGFDGISPEQRRDLLDEMLHVIVQRHCRECTCVIPLGEVLASLDNGGLCAICDQRRAQALSGDA